MLTISTANAILIQAICNLTFSSICIILLGKLNETLDLESETLRSNDPVYWLTEVVVFKHYLIEETKSNIQKISDNMLEELRAKVVEIQARKK